MNDNEWEDIPQEEVVDDNEWEDIQGPSQLDSAGRGFVQEATLGFRDELAGGLKYPLGGAKAIINKFLKDKYNDTDTQGYSKEVQESRALDDIAREANPKSYMGGQFAGGAATSFIPGLGAAKLPAMVASGMLNSLGSSEAESIKDLAEDTMEGGASGALFGKLSEIPVGKMVKSSGDYLKKGAEKFAENATGATGLQASKFADNAGRELLDRKLVRFGDNAENILNRTSTAVANSDSNIKNALMSLDEKGAKVDLMDVLTDMQNKIDVLKKNPSQSAIVKKLEAEMENILNMGESYIPLSQSEVIKQGYNKMAKNWMDPEVGQAGKAAYRTFRDATEREALKNDPALAKMFIDGKKSHGLLSPIEEAGERRVAQQNQSPFGGFSDLVSAGTGMAAGGIPGAIASVVGKRVIAPRVASSAAVTTDLFGDLLKKSPEVFGKYGPRLQNAAARGGNALGATNYVMQQNDPEYRALIRQMIDGEDNE